MTLREGLPAPVPFWSARVSGTLPLSVEEVDSALRALDGSLSLTINDQGDFRLRPRPVLTSALGFVANVGFAWVLGSLNLMRFRGGSDDVAEDSEDLEEGSAVVVSSAAGA